MIIFLPLLLGLSLGCTRAGGFVAHVESTCLLDDDGTAKDFTYCISFNKDLLTCWDPEENKMVPCEFGVLNPVANGISHYLNQQDTLMQRLRNGLQNCTTHTQPFWGSLTHRTRPPSVQVAQWRLDVPDPLLFSLNPLLRGHLHLCGGAHWGS